MVGTDAANATAGSVPAFGSSVGGGLRVGLLRAAGDSPGPFVVLHEGLHGRVLLGEVRSGAAVLARFAWKLRADLERAGTGSAPTNGELDARWQRERQAVASVRSPQLVAPFPLAPELLQSPPLWYCLRAARYFHPVCPDTGAVLRVCRDDDLLASCGLPGYAADRERYLHSGALGLGRVFWQPQPAANRRTVADVRGREQLVAGFGALVHAACGEPRVARAAAALPCLSCEHRLQCYPQGVPPAALPAQRELQVVSFFDVDAVATELQAFDFDEVCTLLGGGDLEPIVEQRSRLGREARLAPAVAESLRGPGQWLFADDPARWPYEVALRKVEAFLQLLDGVAAVHASGRPHLGLAPANVLGNCHAGANPARWGLHVALHDLGSAVVKTLPTPGGEPLFEPGHELLEDLRSRPYVASPLWNADGQSMPLAVTCYRTGEVAGAVRLVVECQGAALPRSVRPGDVVLVQPTAGGAVLVGRLEESRTRGLLAVAALPPGHPCLQWDGAAFEARVAFHRRLGLGADCHGLGVLLLRLLLVDDEQDLDEVMEAFGRCMRWLEDEPLAVRGAPEALAARLQQMLVGREVRARLQPLRLLHRRADREACELAIAAGARPFAAELWSGLLAVVCRLLGNWPQGSFATGFGDDDPGMVGRVRAELERVQRRLHGELFEVEVRDAMVAEVARAWLAEHSARGTASAPPAASGAVAFTIWVQREGSEAVREVPFTGERMTIGRRDDNALQLTDPMVSSAHAAIERAEDGWVAVDRASTNGTEVDGIRLPIEVPQPLQDGSVIGIRPFVLTFRLPVVDLGATLVTGGAIEVPLRERLHAAWAAAVPTARRTALAAVLEQAEQRLGSDAVAAPLWELLREEAPHDAAGAVVDATAAAAAHGLAQLSRALLGAGEFRSAQDVQEFVAKLARFIEASTQGIERLLALRKALGKHLDLGLVSTQSGAPSLRTAADVRQAVLAWEEGSPAADMAGLFVTRFYDDLLAIVGGLLRGSQQVRRAVRERLDPAQLVEAAGREAKLRLLVQAAAGSVLWKLYVQAFAEVTGDEQYERDLEQLLQQALPDLRTPRAGGG